MSDEKFFRDSPALVAFENRARALNISPGPRRAVSVQACTCVVGPSYAYQNYQNQSAQFNSQQQLNNYYLGQQQMGDSLGANYLGNEFMRLIGVQR